MLAEKADRPHPLAFDSTKHKILNSELKHLYTAITRARVNVWIYDEDDEKRKPMFEYLKARRLAISKSVDQGKPVITLFHYDSPLKLEQSICLSRNVHGIIEVLAENIDCLIPEWRS